MAETIKKAKAPAKPRKTTAKKTVERAEPEQHSKAYRGNGPVSHDEVAQLAHHYWAERGYRHGHHEEDWHRAEQELRGKASNNR